MYFADKQVKNNNHTQTLAQIVLLHVYVKLNNLCDSAVVN